MSADHAATELLARTTGDDAETTVPTRPTIKAVKASFNLPKSELDNLRMLAERRGINVTLALRQAIATELWLDEQLREGRRKLMLQEPDGSRREIVFSNYWSSNANPGAVA